MDLIATAKLLFQAAIALLSAALGPNVTPAQAEAAIALANSAISFAQSLPSSSLVSLGSPQFGATTSTVVGEPTASSTPITQAPPVQSPVLGQHAPVPTPMYTLEVVKNEVRRTGGFVTFKILKDGQPVMSPNSQYAGKFAQFDVLYFLGAAQKFTNSNGYTSQASDTGVYELKFRGEEHDAAAITNGNLTVHVELGGQTAELQIPLQSDLQAKAKRPAKKASA